MKMSSPLSNYLRLLCFLVFLIVTLIPAQGQSVAKKTETRPYLLFGSVINIKDVGNGFVIRSRGEFAKYNYDLEKLYDVKYKIPRNQYSDVYDLNTLNDKRSRFYGLIENYMQIVGDNKTTYFVSKPKGSKLYIHEINEKGERKEYSFKKDAFLEYPDGQLTFYIDKSGKLNSYGFKYFKKENKLTYFIYEYNLEGQKITQTRLDLKTSDAGLKALKKFDEYSIDAYSEYLWTPLLTNEEGVHLVKYSGWDNRSLICETRVLSFDKKIASKKQYYLGDFGDENTEFIFSVANARLDLINNRLYFLGMKGGKKKINGFYYLTYDYTNGGKPTFIKKYDFHGINQKYFRGQKKVWISNAPAFAAQGYVRTVLEDDLVYDRLGEVITVKVMEKDVNATDRKKYKNQFTLDMNTGDILFIDKIIEKNSFYNIRPAKNIPSSSRTIWKNNQNKNNENLNLLEDGFYRKFKDSKRKFWIHFGKKDFNIAILFYGNNKPAIIYKLTQ